MEGLGGILSWLTSGDARLVASGILFLLILVLKKAPKIGPWLNTGSGWLTSKRKKLLANIIATSAPIAFMLQTDAPPQEIAMAALDIALVAAGYQSIFRTVKPKKPASDSAKPEAGDEAEAA